MGCDIHAYAEVRDGAGWRKVGDVFPLDAWSRQWHGKECGDAPFTSRNYGVFGFLADVRNYSCVPPIAAQRGFPEDASSGVRAAYAEWEGDAHSASWLTLRDLLDCDYDRTFEDRRYTEQTGPRSWNGGATAEEGKGEMKILRAFLGPGFFADLAVLETLGAPDDVRVVFWFDN